MCVSPHYDYGYLVSLLVVLVLVNNISKIKGTIIKIEFIQILYLVPPPQGSSLLRRWLVRSRQDDTTLPLILQELVITEPTSMTRTILEEAIQPVVCAPGSNTGPISGLSIDWDLKGCHFSPSLIVSYKQVLQYWWIISITNVWLDFYYIGKRVKT